MYTGDVQRYHAISSGPMAGSWELCTSKRCARPPFHLSLIELEAVRLWLQDRQPEQVVQTYKVGVPDATQARSTRRFAELIQEAELLKLAEPGNNTYTRRGLLSRVFS